MPMERMTAKKVMVSDLINGEWVKKEGLEPSFIITKKGEKVSRARLLGTVVSKFVSEDGNFGSLTLDDSTDTIRIKAFKDLKILELSDVGDLVDIIGKVREYNEEIYLIPEIIKKLDDPNVELLRKLEILKKMKTLKAGIKEEERSEGKEDDQNVLRKEIIKIIEANRDGITYSELLEKAKIPEETAEPIINQILAEGICYEPTPGKIKKI